MDRTAEEPLRERHASGIAYLRLVTALLQRERLADPEAGVWEAADLQWWWRRDQHPEPARQVFWLSAGTPVAAVVITDWGDRYGLDPIGAAGGSVAPSLAWDRALEMVDGLRERPVEISVREGDAALIGAVASGGFEDSGGRYATCWMASDARPAVPPLPDGFVLRSRAELRGTPHHMIRRNGERVAERLAECSLYRPDLDLVVHAPDGEVAAYGLFWPDPVTRVGLVEPMRTEDRFAGMGLARHLLREGMDRLARCGSDRLKVGHVIGNEAARRLYVGSGFVPRSIERTYVRPERSPAGVRDAH